MNSIRLEEIQQAIRGEDLDGWLFCNFHHRDRLSDEILGIEPGSTNSRWWVYAVPARGEALGIVHRIEAEALGDLPGRRAFYSGREEFLSIIGSLGGKRWGVHVSRTISAVSWLDAGMAAVFEGAGLRLVSAAGLVQRFKGLLDGAGIASHQRAAVDLYEITALAWERVRRAYHAKQNITEGDIQNFILEEFGRRNLAADHPPIVAAGINSGNPHYDVSPDGGAIIRPGDVIQFDMWAKEGGGGGEGVYADISWVGFYGPHLPPDIEKTFADLVAAREGGYAFIRDEMAAGRVVEGAAVDRKVRDILCGSGYGDALRHRTGHGIDTEVHGSGVNIDSVEFPDSRLLLDGSCFSLEPGIYFADYGLRTEIDVYIQNGKPVISGKDRQFKLLTCADNYHE